MAAIFEAYPDCGVCVVAGLRRAATDKKKQSR
jgi:hypothetical protein